MTVDAQVVRLPGGQEIRVPDGQSPDDVLARHVAASLAEGLCPVHLEPRPSASSAIPGMIAMHCRDCGAYWSSGPEPNVASWTIDHDPHQFGHPVQPDWLARGLKLAEREPG